MKTPRILVLITFVLLLGCAKEDGVGITKFTGNDIDSIVKYSLTTNLDTLPVFAMKFTYSEDKKITTEQWYEQVEGQEELVPTVFNTYTFNGYKLIKKSVYHNDTTTFEYKFNSNLFVISYIKRSNISLEYDSVFYQYDDNNYLYSIKSIHLNNTGEFPYRAIYNYYYTWINGNLMNVKMRQYIGGILNSQYIFNYQYGELINPLSYDANPESPYLRFGRASKNLKDKSYPENQSDFTMYSYLLFPSTKSFLEKSYRENYQSLTKIFYK